MKAVTLSKEDVFNGSTIMNDPGAYATLASQRLLDRFLHFAEKSRSGKIPF